ncbi:3-isopropylmalate dehydratase small subunit [Rhizobium rhizogenes]|uniref:3-isopropylmalate dehydratase small subunit n=1 Tax=Rhizobium rhizogenes TaxID=359 RepID=UPI0015729CE9|nr:3-isopropylmalate dehydratase small subunit [Rhizobium rhizogenes]NTI78524.1 3-isopropylmalate dehydratase small subunit [Rhizobium rhizogenes]
MRKIDRLVSPAACLMADNISTDIISPSYLYLRPRSAYATGLFSPWRYNEDGSPNADFPLNQPGMGEAKILVTGPNFGCGSSREIAVWCLQDYGIDCVIGTSFGDIFFENALKSGLVAIKLAEADVERLVSVLQVSDQPVLVVDLTSQTIGMPDATAMPFAMDEFRRTAHIDGLDEIDIILRCLPDIESFQHRAHTETPWLLESTRPAIQS